MAHSQQINIECFLIKFRHISPTKKENFQTRYATNRWWETRRKKIC